MISRSRLFARLGMATAAFVLIVLTGSFGVERMCFPAYSHGPVRLECDIALLSPAIAAVLCGFFVGWRTPLGTMLWSVAVPVVGLGVVLLTGQLHFWYGEDLWAALRLAALFCLVPALVASFMAAGVSAIGRQHAL